ncbi:hypothetical protein JYU14_05095 [Simkania negevensis]|uniref:Membrane or secreted protein n=1 Tax=Simkania negevensis TaxID=83561 RepID=A0ABS3ASZ2_9BACT|nr:hypothetical protein [Simkania negevensis]
MSSAIATVIIAIIILGLALLGLAAGLILSGKPIKRGSCGYDPNKKDSKKCDDSSMNCDLCGRKDNEDDEQ